jgi:hypothetical protein
VSDTKSEASVMIDATSTPGTGKMSTLSLGRTARNRPAVLRFLAGAVAVAVVLVSQPLTWLPNPPHAWWVDMVNFGVPALLFVPLLPLVSYRRRDALVIAIAPFWNVVLAAKVGWRLANLPARGWRPRSDEPGYAEWQAAQEGIVSNAPILRPTP